MGLNHILNISLIHYLTHFAVQVSSWAFSRIHYNQAREQSNKTIKSISGPINFVNRANDNLQIRWEIAGPEIAQYLEQVRSKILKGTKTHAMFLKDYNIVIRRLLPVNPFMENLFVKIGTNLEYNEQVCHFVDQIPEICQQQY